ncbi:MAG: VWA domain-containing protein [Gammaproteobacteria bacterium]|nr:MAG: VWA domain-containing protein [Gammaproteobacteria bacterium]
MLNRILKLLFVSTLSLLFMGPVHAAGLLQPSDGSLPALEIKQHKVKVTIEDSYAVTQVDQVFTNPHSQDLEAIYSFPVPEHAAVAEFTMWIDGKPVSGEVLEKEEARRVYEEEKSAGRDAGITEKDSYKTFDIRVYPVRAGQDTKIRLVYLQSVHMDTGIGRYVYPLEEGGVDEEKLAFWTANEKVLEKFSFDLHLKNAYPVEALRLPNQPQAVVRQEDGWKASINSSVASTAVEENKGSAQTNIQPVTAAHAYTLDKDIVVYWRQAKGLPGSVYLVAYKPESAKRGTFMMVVTPGDDLQPIRQGSDWVFVLDVSGSMQGKYTSLAEGVTKAMTAMRPNDRFRIVLFNNRSSEVTNGYVIASKENVKRYIAKVEAIKPDNGTNLYAGLREGLDNIEADRTTSVVLVTDGVANVGITAQKDFLKLVKKKDVRLFTFIMGNSANRPLLEALTRASHGFALNISNSDDIVGQLLLAKSKVTHQALHDAKIRIKGLKTSDIEPQTIGSVYRGQQLVIFGHYRGSGEADVIFEGKVSGQDKRYQTRFVFPDIAKRNPEIERLWAYATIEIMISEMEDFGEKADLKQAVTDLGIEYGLVTDYTSMVVMSEDSFTRHGINRTNRERLAIEHTAQKSRATTSAVSNRVDHAKPMFSQPRASTHGGGGGDFGPLGVLLLVPLAIRMMQNRKRSSVV